MPPRWDELWLLVVVTVIPCRGGGLRILAPHDHSEPRSGYVGLKGSGPALTALQIWDGNRFIRDIPTRASGHFDCVLRLDPGEHQIFVRTGGTGESSAQGIHIRVRPFPEPAGAQEYEKLQQADILLSQTPGSEQVQLYGAAYTHAALYLGPDEDGTPLIAEAATPEQEDFKDRIGALPIEETLNVLRGGVAHVYRLPGELSDPERDQIIDWTLRTLSGRVAFWSMTEDLGPFFRAWLLWDPGRDQPRNQQEFDRVLDELRALRSATDRLNCTTLVYQAYWRGTNGRVDLSTPNRVNFGGSVGKMSHRFLERLRRDFMVPDTLALSGKLVRVGTE